MRDADAGRSRITRAALICAALLLPGSAAPSLGGAAGSVAADREALAATASGPIDRGAYSVHELASASNVVREFVGPSGTVFAIAWSGLTHPDLKPLLGRYFDEYQRALQGTKRAHGARRRQVRTAHVVVETWGHMRNLQGRAYVRGELPPGVGVDEIR